jgi:hypothetical protein
MKNRALTVCAAAALVLVLVPGRGQVPDFGTPGTPGCTSIMVGRLATADGSVITSQTVDGSYRTWMTVAPGRRNEAGAKKFLGKRLGMTLTRADFGVPFLGEGIRGVRSRIKSSKRVFGEVIKIWSLQLGSLI